MTGMNLGIGEKIGIFKTFDFFIENQISGFGDFL
jgi:hypothetical protein